jgi:hypothetical protein
MITDRRRAVGSDAVPTSPSEEQRFLQLWINAEATEQRMVTFRMETEIAELDASAASAAAFLASNLAISVSMRKVTILCSVASALIRS